MAGAKNKKQRKLLRRFLRSRRKDLEIKALMTNNPVAKSLANFYATAEAETKYESSLPQKVLRK